MKVLNFGSLNIDYVYQLEHFVKKGETISSDALNVSSGGKGLNQSIALCRAGTTVFHAGAIGTDGIFLQNMMKDVGVQTQFITTFENVRTGNAIIQRDKYGENCIILYGGANQAITKEMVDKVLENFSEGDWLVLQNEINENPYIVEQAHEKKMRIILNPAPMNEKILQINLNYIDCIILNEVEAQELTGQKTLEEVYSGLQSKFANKEIILTLGDKGSVYIFNDMLIRQTAYKVQTVDTTAAGDTFVGYYLSGICQGLKIEDALDLASKAAAITVSRKGAALSIPCKEEVMQFEI